VKPWILDFGETTCSAVRIYGTDADPVTLAFRPSPNGPIVRLAIARKGRIGDAHHFPVTVALGPTPLKTTGLRFATRDNKSNLVWINIERPLLDGLAATGRITLSGGREIEETLALPGIREVLRRLDDCNTELRQYWNAGEFAAALAKPPEPVRPAHTWVSDADYPAQAQAEGASGALRFSVLIDETGKVRDCLVEETSGIATLDAQACIAVTRSARFRPALDAAGKPARSSWGTRFVYRTMID
jgi:TonB family protein